MQNRRVQIVDMHRLLDGLETELIGRVGLHPVSELEAPDARLKLGIVVVFGEVAFVQAPQ